MVELFGVAGTILLAITAIGVLFVFLRQGMSNRMAVATAVGLVSGLGMFIPMTLDLWQKHVFGVAGNNISLETVVIISPIFIISVMATFYCYYYGENVRVRYFSDEKIENLF